METGGEGGRARRWAREDSRSYGEGRTLLFCCLRFSVDQLQFELNEVKLLTRLRLPHPNTVSEAHLSAALWRWPAHYICHAHRTAPHIALLPPELRKSSVSSGAGEGERLAFRWQACAPRGLTLGRRRRHLTDERKGRAVRRCALGVSLHGHRRRAGHSRCLALGSTELCAANVLLYSSSYSAVQAGPTGETAGKHLSRQRFTPHVRSER